ncbi:MAG: hypothetical protein HY063_07060 [Bacteroidetes bacterium]|nr:hypothetical protein [Bacteroidota bacterium]
MKRIFVLIFFLASVAVFSQDSTNTFDYNYKKGMKYYNNGVDSIKKYVPGSQFPQCSKMPEQAMSQFKKAFPYLEKARLLNPKDETTLKALMGTASAVGNNEKYIQYKKELEALNKK